MENLPGAVVDFCASSRHIISLYSMVLKQSEYNQVRLKLGSNEKIQEKNGVHMEYAIGESKVSGVQIHELPPASCWPLGSCPRAKKTKNSRCWTEASLSQTERRIRTRGRYRNPTEPLISINILQTDNGSWPKALQATLPFDRKPKSPQVTLAFDRKRARPRKGARHRF